MTASTPPEPLLRIRGLKASFKPDEPGSDVLRDISLELFPGETLGVVGESGSGKSLTSLSVMRLIPSPPIHYSAGEILFEGQELLSNAPQSMESVRGARIAMIFQEPMSSLNPVQRCGKQVAEILLTHRRSDGKHVKEEVRELFRSVRLPDPERAYNSYPHELSGGQMQRVMIAMAIACEPDVLIADEPTTALDVTVQREIIELLQDIQERMGMAMIFISHDLAVIRAISNRIIVMRHGEIVEQGDANRVLKNPQHPYTKGLLGSRPPVSGRPRRLLTIEDAMMIEDSIEEISQEERRTRHADIYRQEPLIQGESICVRYPIRSGVLQKVNDYVEAVDKVDIELYRGETLGIVGESGSGKSSLGRAIIGLESIAEGKLSYDGRSVSDFSEKDRMTMKRNVQMIFQDPYGSLDPRQSIGDSIAEPMEVHGIGKDSKERRNRVLSLLEKVGLEASHYTRYPHEFSGGQRQRIGIARALALEPEVVICDESVSALDVSVQAQVLNLLNQLKAEFGLSYIFISHDLSVVRFMSDRIMVMRSGRLMEYGEADRLYSSPESEYTMRLIESAYDLD